jgi:hypothetical protein
MIYPHIVSRFDNKKRASLLFAFQIGLGKEENTQHRSDRKTPALVQGLFRRQNIFLPSPWNKHRTDGFFAEY